jgi:proteasome alpha subunit
MTLPIYASPEQFMRDRSEYARKGIGRGRSVVVTTYAGGILFVAENNWRTLHKVSEIYDRIGFAAVGRYNEFENLRTAGIRLADVRGYSYDRRDVTGRWLANAYAQTLGSIFSEHQKPFEVELCVAEVGRPDDGSNDQLYRISYDGSIIDETRYVVMGGMVDPVAASLETSFVAGWELGVALRTAVAALGAAGDGAPRELGAAQVEVAILDRTRTGRTFRRFHDDDVAALLLKAEVAAESDDDAEETGGGAVVKDGSNGEQEGDSTSS